MAEEITNLGPVTYSNDDYENLDVTFAKEISSHKSKPGSRSLVKVLNAQKTLYRACMDAGMPLPLISWQASEGEPLQ